MMQLTAMSKVTAEHLSRNAYLYVRQSTLRQVIENTESTKRQYGLRQRAVALGWSDEQIVVIDKDLGRSAASASDRAGFGELVAEVGMGRAGIVLGLEVSRLARNNTDCEPPSCCPTVGSSSAAVRVDPATTRSTSRPTCSRRLGRRSSP